MALRGDHIMKTVHTNEGFISLMALRCDHTRDTAH